MPYTSNRISNKVFLSQVMRFDFVKRGNVTVFKMHWPRIQIDMKGVKQ